MFTFTDALVLAAEAHKGKKDIGGVDYIKHPLYVYHKIKMKGGSNEAQMTAILHDVIEDSHVTIENLEFMNCPESVVDALRLLSHNPDKGWIQDRAYDLAKMNGRETANQHDFNEAKEEEYLNYARYLSRNDIARAVKIEDLRHNSDIRRAKFSHTFKEKDILLIRKYIKALQVLTGGKVGYA